MPHAKHRNTTSKVEILSSKRKFHGPVFDVFTDMIAEPGAAAHRKDVIRHKGSAVILAVDHPRRGEPRVLLARQYRHAAKKYLWELPAGRLEPGETPLAGARRELAEETGFRARKWSKLTSFFASPGFLAEKMKVFLAENLTAGDESPDPDEIITHRFFDLSKALQMAATNKLEDGKTILALLLYARGHKTRK
jgi:ADP-ribose pyrophosphatase